MQDKKLINIIAPQEKHWVGDGFYVSTLFSPQQIDYRNSSPFILMDYAAPKYFEPSEQKRGVGEHPHRGFETVTFAIQGEIEHRDSGGGGGKITSGGVQWMTAGSGVVHEEFHSRDFTQNGGSMEMVQLWVNLSKENKMITPRYQSLEKTDFALAEIGSSSRIKIISGAYKDHIGPAKTFSPITIYEIESDQDDSFLLEFEEGTNLLLLQLRGASQFGGSSLSEGRLAYFEREGSKIELNTEKGSKVLVLNAHPIDEPIATYGPFVMNTREEIMQAIQDYQAGKMGSLVREA